MTIEIDDAGTGDLIGNAFIGLLVLEDGKMIFRSVPVGMYNEKNLKENMLPTMCIAFIARKNWQRRIHKTVMSNLT